MGEVWAAQRAGQFGFERLVALKLLKNAAMDSNAAVMFFDEARAASALQHAAIVPTFDLGQYGSIFYISMGMVRGPSLTALLQRLAVKKTPVPPAIVAYMGERLASALDYAYERAEIEGKKLRLIHRDISPHNVLLDETGNVVLTDFGVARTAVQDHESRVGTVRGKPSYMAPEQVSGGAMDARTDVFALGIVLYESSCVKRLFGRSNPVKSMEAVVHYQPKPLPDLVPGYPDALWRVLQKALQKDPADRFQSAGELARALSEVARTLPGAASASRDLPRLIADSFPPGSFDVDARVREALEQAPEDAPPEVLEATKLERHPSNAGLPEPTRVAPFAEVIGTHVWPTSQAPDPLDPEALLVVEAELTGSRQVPPSMFTPSNSSPSYSQISGSSGLPPPVVASRSAKPAVIAACLAALVAVGAAYGVATQSEDTLELPIPPARTEVAPIARPSAQALPGAVAPAAEVRPEPVSPPPAAEEPVVRKPKRVAPPPTSRRPEPIKKQDGEQVAPLAAQEDLEATPATRAEVYGLISKLEQIDPGQASSMKATLAESGGNVATLEMLRRQAIQALKTAGQ